MCLKLVSLTSSVGSVRTRSIMNAQLEAQKELFINKLHQGLESGLGAERSQFLTKQKYDEIVKCLQQWESMSAKERKEQWPQGHAWLKKYALFGEGESAVLIFNPDELEVKRLKKSGGKDAAGVRRQHPSTTRSSCPTRAGCSRTCTRCMSREGTASRGRSSTASRPSSGRAESANSSHESAELACLQNGLPVPG